MVSDLPIHLGKQEESKREASALVIKSYSSIRPYGGGEG